MQAITRLASIKLAVDKQAVDKQAFLTASLSLASLTVQQGATQNGCLQAAMGGGMGAGVGGQDLQRLQAAERLQAIQAEIAPQLIEAVQGGMGNNELAGLLNIPEDQAAALVQVVREGQGCSLLVV